MVRSVNLFPFVSSYKTIKRISRSWKGSIVGSFYWINYFTIVTLGYLPDSLYQNSGRAKGPNNNPLPLIPTNTSNCYWSYVPVVRQSLISPQSVMFHSTISPGKLVGLGYSSVSSIVIRGWEGVCRIVRQSPPISSSLGR